MTTSLVLTNLIVFTGRIAHMVNQRTRDRNECDLIYASTITVVPIFSK
jgi:hypothetical protein